MNEAQQTAEVAMERLRKSIAEGIAGATGRGEFRYEFVTVTNHSRIEKFASDLKKGGFAVEVIPHHSTGDSKVIVTW